MRDDNVSSDTSFTRTDNNLLVTQAHTVSVTHVNQPVTRLHRFGEDASKCVSQVK